MYCESKLETTAFLILVHLGMRFLWFLCLGWDKNSTPQRGPGNKFPEEKQNKKISSRAEKPIIVSFKYMLVISRSK